MDTISRAAEAYSFDFLGGMNNDWYLWDFGAFFATGPQENPTKPLTVFGKYHILMSDDTTLPEFAEREPDITTEIELLEYDYRVYLLVPLANATHIVNPDTGVPFEISEEVTIGGQDGVVLRSEERRDTEKTAISTNVLEGRVNDSGWAPVVDLLAD